MTDQHRAAPEPEPADELFAHFANEVRLMEGSGGDPGGDVETLTAWLHGRGLVSTALARSRIEPELPAFRDLGTLVRSIAARATVGRPPSARQIVALNRVLRDGVHYHALRSEPDGVRFSMRPVGDDLRQARAAIAGSLAHYLAEHDPGRLRVCASETCRWVFVDRSAAGRRRWCDMRTCGNRAKVARHRQRARSSPPDS
jgi:predicted RNA-binding Zn ribbon-like protein